MKIGHLENQAATPAASERKSAAATPSTAAGTSVEASAKVALSPTVSQLTAVSSEGVFDVEKVQRISDAIRDGKFVVNADAIADKLIANAQELLGNVAKR
ncbi:MAG: flagellar biosynthesis anti-sigma factor FlgM [Burkholderiales bacterium RIFCSPHIGHO2_12_FULL_69_20]|nr:MAG: flagellar biosynthesis anti-sigma factor FlgM [Burkholderiales bacterium RIFCSPHIGHO2_12_FULL_69_20]